MGKPDIDQMSNVLNKGIFPQEIEDNLNGGTKVVKIQLEKGDTVELGGVELEYKDGFYEVTEKGEKVLKNDINKGKALPVGSERNWGGTTYIKKTSGEWKPKGKGGSGGKKEKDKNGNDGGKEGNDSKIISNIFSYIKNNAKEVSDTDDLKSGTTNKVYDLPDNDNGLKKYRGEEYENDNFHVKVDPSGSRVDITGPSQKKNRNLWNKI